MLNSPKQKPELVFNAEKHEYRVNGIVWPNVTGLIQEFGLVDFSNVPQDRLEYKKVLGSAVDVACNYLDHGILDKASLDERLIPYVQAYEKFCLVTGFEIDSERSQVPLVSRKWRFCGTNDMFGNLEGERVIVDPKCTWVLYEPAGTQLAGYEMLWNENYPKEKVHRRYALQLKPNGNYDLKEYSDKTDFTDFQACLHLHWQKRNKYKTAKGESHDYDNSNS